LTEPSDTITGLVYRSVRETFSPPLTVLEGDRESCVIVNILFLPQLLISPRIGMVNRAKARAKAESIMGLFFVKGVPSSFLV